VGDRRWCKIGLGLATGIRDWAFYGVGDITQERSLKFISLIIFLRIFDLVKNEAIPMDGLPEMQTAVSTSLAQ